MKPRVQLTLRIPPDQAARLAEIAGAANISLNQAGAALLERALMEGWRVRSETLGTENPACCEAGTGAASMGAVGHSRVPGGGPLTG
jgi:hypothetical protein